MHFLTVAIKEQSPMIAFIESAGDPIILDGMRPTLCTRDTSLAIWERMRASSRAVSEILQRRFAAFARVPYHDPLDLEQWEQLWDAESLMSRE